jgi:ferredoxin
MPKVLAQGKTIECNERANLRKVLLHDGIDLYNGGASFINCRDIGGSCATCAVKVKGEVSAANWRDNARRWSVCCQACSFVKRLPRSFARRQPL